MRILLPLVAFLLLASTAHAGPKPSYGVLSLTNTPGPQTQLEYHLYRMPRQPVLAVACFDVNGERWLREMAAGRGLDWSFQVDLTTPSSWNPKALPPYPPSGNGCSAWGQSEGSANGKDATLITNVLFFEVLP